MSDKDVLQAAVDAVVAGHSVTIPRRTFYISGSILVEAEHFELYGNLCRIVQLSPNSKTLLFKGCVAGEVRGFVLYGHGTELNGLSSSFNGVSGIFMDDCADMDVHHNYLYNHVGGGIRWTKRGEGINVHHNRTTGIGSAGGIQDGDNSNDVGIGSVTTEYNTDIDISHNRIRGHCFGASVGRGDGIIVTGNLIADIPGQHGTYMQEASGLTISNNIFRNIKYIAIKTQVAKIDTIVKNTLISDNQMYDLGQSGISVNTTDTAGENSGFEGVMLSSNVVDTAGSYGAQVRKAKKVTVKDQVIRDVGAYGLLLQKFAGKVSENEIYTSGWSAIYVECSGHVNLRYNDVHDPVQNPAGESSSSRTRDGIVLIKAVDAPEGDVKATATGNTVTNTLPAGSNYTKSLSVKTGVVLDLIDNTDNTSAPPTSDGGTINVIRSL